MVVEIVVFFLYLMGEKRVTWSWWQHLTHVLLFPFTVGPNMVVHMEESSHGFVPLWMMMMIDLCIFFSFFSHLIWCYIMENGSQLDEEWVIWRMNNMPCFKMRVSSQLFGWIDVRRSLTAAIKANLDTLIGIPISRPTNAIRRL